MYCAIIISVLIGITYAGVTIAPLPYSMTKQELINQEEVQHENINIETTEETVNDMSVQNNVDEYLNFEDDNMLSEHDIIRTISKKKPCLWSFIKDVISTFARCLMRHSVSTNLLFVILFPVLIISVCTRTSICYNWANQMNLFFPPDFDSLILTRTNLHLLAEIVSEAVDNFSAMQVEWNIE